MVCDSYYQVKPLKNRMDNYSPFNWDFFVLSILFFFNFSIYFDHIFLLSQLIPDLPHLPTHPTYSF